MTKKNPINVKMLRRVKKHILENPRRFLMGSFVLRKGLIHSSRFSNDSNIMVPFASCGTAACIAGWTCLLHDPKIVLCGSEYAKKAEQILGLTVSQSQRLFYVGQWPESFQQQYENEDSEKKRAVIAANRIEYMIKNGV